MSKIVEVPRDKLEFPKKCCRCLGDNWELKLYKDQPVMGIIPGGVIFREICVLIPVCRKCRIAPKLWILAAFIWAGICIFAFSVCPGSITSIIAPLLFISVVFLVISLFKRPLNILGANNQYGTIRFKFYNDEYAYMFFEANGRQGYIRDFWSIC